MTLGAVREPAVVHAMAVNAHPRRGVAVGSVVAVEAAKARVAAGQCQVTCWLRLAKDPPDRNVALPTIIPASVGGGVARLACLGWKRSAFDMAPLTTDHAMKCRAGVEVGVRVRVIDHEPRLKTVAFATVTQVGKLVLVRVGMTSLGGARQSRIKRRVGVRRHGVPGLSNEECNNDSNHNCESA